jgi:hypothetical protein
MGQLDVMLGVLLNNFVLKQKIPVSLPASCMPGRKKSEPLLFTRVSDAHNVRSLEVCVFSSVQVVELHYFRVVDFPVPIDFS